MYMAKRYLNYRASPEIIDLLRQEGLQPNRIKVFAGPAGGPKWFVSAGFDRALISSKLLQRESRRTLLAGASAGAWRCFAMACKEPLEAYEKLRIAYSRNVFDEKDTPASFAEALQSNVEAFITDEDVEHILHHPYYDLAAFTVRSKSLAASSNKHAEGIAILIAALLNILTPATMRLFYERTLFYTGDRAPDFTKNFNGTTVPITPSNLKSVALATGSLPYIIAGVTELPEAPQGVYRDGGLTDYQLNQDFAPGDGLTLFFHYQERIAPGWFDKKLKWRAPTRRELSRVLQVYPSDDFINLLPGKRIPDRTDFTTYVDRPQERIRIWDKVSELSDILGAEFLEDVATNRIGMKARPF